MRVFVLCTGRCGSLTFSKACCHLTNYTAAHESGLDSLDALLLYPDNHIEVDNRLVWMIERIDQLYPDAFYLWLARNRDDVVDSYAARFGRPRSIVTAYAMHILRLRDPMRRDAHAVADSMIETVTAMICRFYVGLPDSRRLHGCIEDAGGWFTEFAERIGATGDIDRAKEELLVRHNARVG